MIDKIGAFWDISIHALLAESDKRHINIALKMQISIHALLAESDGDDVLSMLASLISIHALLAESDVSLMLYDTSSLIFLSTLSLRRATIALLIQLTRKPDFYPRSPCGERPFFDALSKEESTFLSTLSLRRATSRVTVTYQPTTISIHALLAESDAC